MTMMEDGELEEAVRLLEDVRSRSMELQSSPASLASTTLELGRAHLELRHFQAALDHFARARETYERIYGSAHASTVNCARLMAATLAHVGREDEAETILKQAADSYEQARIRGGTRLARATQRLDSPYELMAALCLARGATEEAWRYTERARARMLTELLTATEQRNLDPEQEASERTLLRKLSRLESEAAALNQAPTDSTASQRSAGARAAAAGRGRMVEVAAGTVVDTGAHAVHRLRSGPRAGGPAPPRGIGRLARRGGRRGNARALGLRSAPRPPHSVDRIGRARGASPKTSYAIACGASTRRRWGCR